MTAEGTVMGTVHTGLRSCPLPTIMHTHIFYSIRFILLMFNSLATETV